MGLLSENEPGYDAGSCLTCVSEDGIGKMLLIHGAVDDNVHVSNAFALMDRLHQEQHPFDSMIYPNVGHGLTRDGSRRMWDFLLGHVSHKTRFFRVFPKNDLPRGRFRRYFFHQRRADRRIDHPSPSRLRPRKDSPRWLPERRQRRRQPKRLPRKPLLARPPRRPLQRRLPLPA